MKAFAIALSLFIVALAPAQTRVKLPKEVRAAYAAQMAAWRKGDLATFFSYFDPTFEYHKVDGGTENLDQFMKQVSDMARDATKRTVTVKFTSCATSGQMTDVSYVATFGLTNPKAKPKVSRVREVGTDTWKKADGGWKLVKTVDKSFGPVK